MPATEMPRIIAQPATGTMKGLKAISEFMARRASDIFLLLETSAWNTFSKLREL
jgi:hypothetical protein